jgi:hypothetical protein
MKRHGKALTGTPTNKSGFPLQRRKQKKAVDWIQVFFSTPWGKTFCPAGIKIDSNILQLVP